MWWLADEQTGLNSSQAIIVLPNGGSLRNKKLASELQKHAYNNSMVYTSVL